MEKEKDEADRWDSVASQFYDLKVPDWSQDLFLKTIAPLPVWGRDKRILDLGCGAGRYSIALSERCGHVKGSDISPGMISFAEKKKAEYGRDNITFVNENWHDIDINERGYGKRFDLVMGHMTPALDTPENIMKATQASKGYCALATFAKRTSPMQDKFYEFMECTPGWKTDNKKLPQIFAALYEEGYYPQVSYYQRDDTQEFDENEAVKFLTERYELDGHIASCGNDNKCTEKKSETSADNAVTEKIRAFVRENMKSGVFVNEVDATIVTLVWCADREYSKNIFPGYKR